MRRLLKTVSLEPCNINKYWLGVFIFIWLIAIGLGAYIAFDHAWTPGESTRLKEKCWPQFSNLKQSQKNKTLVLFVHPKCPCTNSSLIELRNLIEKSKGGHNTKIVFFVPGDFGDEWIEEDKINLANAVPGAEIVYDYDGKEMRTFGAATSGQLYIFASDKKMLYSGGITPGRGHIGTNPGFDNCLEILASNDNQYGTAPVFGCPMEQPK